MGKILEILQPRFYREIYYDYIGVKKTVAVDEKTVFVWEPCTKNHAEVVPGFCRYLLDLGYRVIAFVHPDRLKEGLFARFAEENLYVYGMRRKQVFRYLKHTDINMAQGMIVTTAGKIVKNYEYERTEKELMQKYGLKRVWFVDHDCKEAKDCGKFLDNKIVMLREMDYCNAAPIAINPHYFGRVAMHQKEKITRFITVGKLHERKKDMSAIVEAAEELVRRKITSFQIVVIGDGTVSNLPEEIQPYFEIKGRLDFAQMYDALEEADFFLTAYSKKIENHMRYITTGTSGNFQLIYGFALPCIIQEEFAEINRFDASNSILYEMDYTEAMKRAIEMPKTEYRLMKEALHNTVEKIYQQSKANMKTLLQAQDGKTDLMGK